MAEKRKSSSRRKAPAAERAPEPTAKKKKRKRAKHDGGRRAAIAFRDAIGAALIQDRALVKEATERPANQRGKPVIVHAADMLEPVLAEAVRDRPSFLGRIAYGTAQLISTLASEDRSSSRRLAEIAADGKEVGIVFVDVVGFTAFTSTNGDDAAVSLVKRLEEIVATVCRRHDGEVVKHLGDGFFLAFPSASKAVRGALALRDAMRNARARDPLVQMVRIAVHSGTPSLVRDDLIGHDVNIAARMLEHCPPGEVLVTEQAKRSAGNRLRTVSFIPAGKAKAKGLPDPVATFVADTNGTARA